MSDKNKMINSTDVFFYVPGGYDAYVNLTDVIYDNVTLSVTSSVPPDGALSNHAYHLPWLVLLCIILGMMIVVTIVGNVFVIVAIILERTLQGVSNYLILSLAVTDLMVAVLVMPISVIHQVSNKWFLGNEMCDMWISFDVLCCTASILHLVAISFDRYWGVSNIDYIRRRNARKIIIMIFIVWVLSVTISIPPLFGWKDNKITAEDTGDCFISQDLGYTVFSTSLAFYFPLTLMIVLNYKIYMTARTRIRKKRFSGQSRQVPETTVTAADGGVGSQNSSGSDVSQDGYSAYNNGSCLNMNEVSRMDEISRVETAIEFPTDNCLVPPTSPTQLTVPGKLYVVCKSPARSNNNHKKVKNREKEKMRRERIEMKRERKAARVLGIITGAFVACWLPFFTMALIGPFCRQYVEFPDAMMSIFLWLGYFNSSLNPILYTIFNPSFRTAFRKILFGKYRGFRYQH